MGFRYRKSINLGGGFRVNLSKSGIGYSWGTKRIPCNKKAGGSVKKHILYQEQVYHGQRTAENPKNIE